MSEARAAAAEEPGWFVPERNCWRTCAAERVAVLIDADAYFGAVADAIARAERSVLVLSWDIDSRTALDRGRTDDPDASSAAS